MTSTGNMEVEGIEADKKNLLFVGAVLGHMWMYGERDRGGEGA